MAWLRRRHNLGVLGLLLLLGWLVCFGAETQLTSRSYGGPVKWDAGAYIWFFWHLKQALLGQAQLLYSDMLFYPHGLYLIRQDWTPVTGLMALPFSGLGPLAAYNLQYVLAYAFTGLATYRLACHLGACRTLALLGALIFTFCEFRLLKAHYHGQPGHAHQEFIPLYLLCFLLFSEHKKGRWAILAGLCFFLAAFTNPYQMVFLLLFTLLLWGRDLLALLPGLLGGGGPAGLWALSRQALVFSLVAGGTALALVAPLLLASWETFLDGVTSLGSSTLRHSADLYSYLHSSMDLRPESLYLYNESWAAFQGYTVMALAAVCLVSRLVLRTSGGGRWFAAAAIFFLFSLGEQANYNQEPLAAMPLFGLLDQLPVLRGVRLSARFSSMVSLCLALAIALAGTRLLARARRRWGAAPLPLVLGLVLILVGTELLSGRLQHHQQGRGGFEVQAPSYVSYLASHAGRTLLTYPLIWETRSQQLGPHLFPRQLLALQTLHGKRMVTGLGDAIPARTLRRFRAMPLLSQLYRIQMGERLPPPTDEERRLARRLVRRLEISHILLFRTSVSALDFSGRYNTERAAQYLRQLLAVKTPFNDDRALLLEVGSTEQKKARVPPLGSVGK